MYILVCEIETIKDSELRAYIAPYIVSSSTSAVIVILEEKKKKKLYTSNCSYNWYEVSECVFGYIFFQFHFKYNIHVQRTLAACMMSVYERSLVVCMIRNVCFEEVAPTACVRIIARLLYD